MRLLVISVFLACVGGLALLECRDSAAEEPKPRYVRIARVLVGAEAVQSEPRRVIALWRHQFDRPTPTWRGDENVAQAAAHAHSPGRILEVRDVPADLSGPGVLLTRFVYPWQLVLPRPALRDAVAWDPHRTCAWLICVSSTSTSADVRAVRVPRGGSVTEEGGVPESLVDWPSISETPYRTTLEGKPGPTDWSVRGLSAAASKEGVLVTLHGRKHAPTRWLWFLPESGAWKVFQPPIPEGAGR